MARKFLYVVAALIAMTIAAALAYRLFGPQLMKLAMVPGIAFEAQSPLPANAYAGAGRWIARPDKPGNPALWAPPGYAPVADPQAAVFFVHPTSYLNRAHWNAPVDDAAGNDLAATFVRGQASVFNGIGAVWVPAYRQATFGAFLTDKTAANQALDLAYGDVRAAFDTFLAQAGDRPLILAGHSQGSLHLLRLLKERVAGQPVARRIAAVYLGGWPVSRTADLPALGLPECTRADQAGCILSWQSFGEPADPAMVTDIFDAGPGLTGAARRGTAMICTNPITGTPDSAAPAAANLGTLYPSADLKTATIAPGRVPARCAGRGLVMIGPAPADFQRFVLPGNNYHVFDYSLFWANLRADAARRVASFTAGPR